MSGDWLKVEVGTPDKPAIKQVARMCGCSTAEAFLAWFRLWSWFDSLTEDGTLFFVKPEDCDEQAGLQGLAAALVSVRWLEFDDRGAVVIGWEKHNGTTAKSRANTAKRVAKFRSKKTL